jgi:hypothetical protein
MNGLALLVMGLALGAENRELIPPPAEVNRAAIEIGTDVFEMQTRRFAMPIMIDAARLKEIKSVRAFVSEDQGKTWRHLSDHEPTEKAVKYMADKDGLYWFAVQVVDNDGKRFPEKTDDLQPVMKVFVNQERRVLKPAKSYQELQREVDELRNVVAELKKKIAELEKERQRD